MNLPRAGRGRGHSLPATKSPRPGLGSRLADPPSLVPCLGRAEEQPQNEAAWSQVFAFALNPGVSTTALRFLLVPCSLSLRTQQEEAPGSGVAPSWLPLQSWPCSTFTGAQLLPGSARDHCPLPGGQQGGRALVRDFWEPGGTLTTSTRTTTSTTLLLATLHFQQQPHPPADVEPPSAATITPTTALATVQPTLLPTVWPTTTSPALPG